MEDQAHKNTEMNEVHFPASITHTPTVNSSAELYTAGHNKHQLNFVSSRLQNSPLLIELLPEEFN